VSSSALHGLHAVRSDYLLAHLLIGSVPKLPGFLPAWLWFLQALPRVFADEPAGHWLTIAATHASPLAQTKQW